MGQRQDTKGALAHLADLGLPPHQRRLAAHEKTCLRFRSVGGIAIIFGTLRKPARLWVLFVYAPTPTTDSGGSSVASPPSHRGCAHSRARDIRPRVPKKGGYTY